MTRHALWLFSILPAYAATWLPSAPQAAAAPPRIVVTEIYDDVNDENDFVEIVNVSKERVDLSTYVLAGKPGGLGVKDAAGESVMSKDVAADAKIFFDSYGGPVPGNVARCFPGEAGCSTVLAPGEVAIIVPIIDTHSDFSSPCKSSKMKIKGDPDREKGEVACRAFVRRKFEERWGSGIRILFTPAFFSTNNSKFWPTLHGNEKPARLTLWPSVATFARDQKMKSFNDPREAEFSLEWSTAKDGCDPNGDITLARCARAAKYGDGVKRSLYAPRPGAPFAEWKITVADSAKAKTGKAMATPGKLP